MIVLNGELMLNVVPQGQYMRVAVCGKYRTVGEQTYWYYDGSAGRDVEYQNPAGTYYFQPTTYGRGYRNDGQGSRHDANKLVLGSLSFSPNHDSLPYVSRSSGGQYSLHEVQTVLGCYNPRRLADNAYTTVRRNGNDVSWTSPYGFRIDLSGCDIRSRRVELRGHAWMFMAADADNVTVSKLAIPVTAMASSGQTALDLCELPFSVQHWTYNGVVYYLVKSTPSAKVAQNNPYSSVYPDLVFGIQSIDQPVIAFAIPNGKRMTFLSWGFGVWPYDWI